MNKGGGGVGIGSASIVLVFAVLCLTVFSMISLLVAGNDKALVDAEAELVAAYYEADILAEQIMSDIISSDEIPASARGVDIEAEWDEELEAFVAKYFCPVTDKKELYVRLAIGDGSYEILGWRLGDLDSWDIDEGMDVFFFD